MATGEYTTRRFTAPVGGVVKGSGYLIGSLFTVARAAAAAAAKFNGAVSGIWTLPKTSAQAWTEGEKIYWNTSTSKADSIGTTGPLIGVAAAVAADPSSTGSVVLNGVAPDVPSTVDTAELAFLNGATAGTVVASKAVVASASSGVDVLKFGAIGAIDASLAIDGLAAAQGGDVVATGGTSSTAGNAGGVAKIVGGTPGSTGVGGKAQVIAAAGGSASGAGGAAEVTGGAGTAGNGAGGSVVLTPGANHGTGIAGGVFRRSATGQLWSQQVTVPADLADTAPTLTAAQMLSGILTGTPTTGRAYTLPTGTEMQAGSPAALATGDSFELTIINLAAGADDIITVTAGADFTIVGKPTIQPADAVGNSTFATFRCVRTVANTFVAYRIG